MKVRREDIQETDLLYYEVVSSFDAPFEDVETRFNPLNDDGTFTENLQFIIKMAKEKGLEWCKQQMTRLIAAKQFYSDLEQNKKLDANGLYGYVGAAFAEYTAMFVAADVTAEGRFLFKALDTQTTNLLDNIEVNINGVKTRLLDHYCDFQELKGLFSDIVRVDKLPDSIPHLVESRPIKETKRKGQRSLPFVEYTGETTRHTVIYGDTDSICIGFDNICTSFGIDIENDEPIRVARFVEWFCLKVLIPFQHDTMKKMCDRRNVPSKYILECEQVMNKLHLYAKKCYCSSLMILDGKDVSKKAVVKAGGIVVKKNSYPKMVRDLLKELLNTMLRPDMKEKNSIPQLLDLMTEHINKLRNTSVSDLCNTNTVRVFDAYSELVEGRYVPLKGAGVNEKGIITYNNMVLSRGSGEPLLGNGSKVKTYPFIRGVEVEFFSWDMERMDEPPEWAPKPAIDILINKKYTANAAIYLTTEYPQLIGLEERLSEPWNFPLGAIQEYEKEHN